MVQEQQTFLEKLEQYFKDKVVKESAETITLPLDSIFTKDFDREIVRNAFVTLFCKANQDYKAKIRKNNKLYTSVPNVDLQISSKGVNIVATAPDGTKIVATRDDKPRGPFYAISEERLNYELLKSFNFKTTIAILKQANVTGLDGIQFRTNVEKSFEGRKATYTRMKKIKEMMSDAAENIINLDREKRKRDFIKYGAKVEDLGYNREKIGKVVSTGGSRKSDKIEFNQIEQTLLDMKPIHDVNVAKTWKYSVEKPVNYHTFVYQNPRETQGYLLVSEPEEGYHHTRVRFISKEKFDNLPPEDDKFVSVTRAMLQQSMKEFRNTTNSIIIYHTGTEEEYTEKLRRIVKGEKTKDPIQETRYAQMDEILFKGAIILSKEQLADRMKGLRHGDIDNARGALYGQTKKKEEDKSIV